MAKIVQFQRTLILVGENSPLATLGQNLYSRVITSIYLGPKPPFEQLLVYSHKSLRLQYILSLFPWFILKNFWLILVQCPQCFPAPGYCHLTVSRVNPFALTQPFKTSSPPLQETFFYAYKLKSSFVHRKLDVNTEISIHSNRNWKLTRGNDVKFFHYPLNLSHIPFLLCNKIFSLRRNDFFFFFVTQNLLFYREKNNYFDL